MGFPDPGSLIPDPFPQPRSPAKPVASRTSRWTIPRTSPQRRYAVSRGQASAGATMREPAAGTRIRWCENPFSHPRMRAAGARILSRTHTCGNPFPRKFPAERDSRRYRCEEGFAHQREFFSCCEEIEPLWHEEKTELIAMHFFVSSCLRGDNGFA